MAMRQTETDFEQMSWHECHIWRIDFLVGDPEDDGWTGDLALGLDFILEWMCGVDGKTAFKIAPATLVFHAVTDPNISIDWGDTDLHTAIHDVSIDRIEREQVQKQKVYPDRPYYRWRIDPNWPSEGSISFCAAVSTQTLLSQPVICARQRLSLRERSRRTTG